MRQVPIIAPIREKKFEVLERTALPTSYSNEFLVGLMANPELIRNIAVVGHLHHGKTIVRATASELSILCKSSLSLARGEEICTS